MVKLDARSPSIGEGPELRVADRETGEGILVADLTLLAAHRLQVSMQAPVLCVAGLARDRGPRLRGQTESTRRRQRLATGRRSCAASHVEVRNSNPVG